MEAIWKSVFGFPLYEVSDLGEIRNAATKRAIKQRRHSAGYLSIDLHSGKGLGLSSEVKQTTVLVHAVVCSSFHGPKPTDRHEVAHFDGNRHNNRAENLRWATRSENHAELPVDIPFIMGQLARSRAEKSGHISNETPLGSPAITLA